MEGPAHRATADAGTASGGHGAALRPGHLRGAESLPPGRRADRGVPSGCERAAAEQVRSNHGHAAVARGALHRGHEAAGRRAPRLRSRGAGQPLRPAGDGRHRALPRCPQLERVRVLHHRAAHRVVLQGDLGRCGLGQGADQRIVRAGVSRRHRCGEGRGQLLRRRCASRHAPRASAARRCSSSARAIAQASKRWEA